MCGISGSVGALDETIHEAVEAMTRAQRHRGPDDEGLWSHDDGERRGVALGHRRLSILDLSPLGHQPMVDPESGCVISYNGEVYNYRELRRELQEQGVRFTSESDTEVVLKAYAAFGVEALGRLRGMFALAIFDPTRERVVLARDRLGVKPLYYAVTGSGGDRAVLFASELRALLASGRVARKIDPAALACYLWNGVTIGPETILDGVRLVPAGHYLEVGLDGSPGEPLAFWQSPHHAPLSEDDSVEALRDALRQAVQMRLVSDVPLGIFLSGGIDSSAIAALAVRDSSGPVTTVNIAFEEGRYDESPHARRVARALGTDHREVRLSEQRFREGLPAALSSLDQPTFDAINTFFVSAAVREAGLTVALAGTGGDELFGGYSSFVDLGRAARAARLARPLPGLARDVLGAAITRLRTGAPGAVPPQTRWGKLRDVLATEGELLRLYQVSYALFTRDFQEQLSSRQLDAGVDWGLPRSRARELAAWVSAEPELSAISRLELAFFLGERLLRDTDAASMAVSLEVRVPLIDHVVVERLANVPEARRYLPARKKALLRELAMPELDPSIFDRPKAGFELPLDVWCRRELRGELQDTLGDREACRRTGLDPDAVARLWRAYQDGAPGLYWSRVWALYILLWWCREHRVSV